MSWFYKYLRDKSCKWVKQVLGFIPFSLSLVVCVCVFFLCIFVGEEVEKMENDQREYEKYPDSVGIIWNTAYLSIWYES